MKKALAFLLMVYCFAIFTACSKKCDHQYQESITADASCKEVGIKTFTCSLCQDSYTEEIPMIEHTMNTRVVTKAPTCLDDGVESISCSKCGHEITQVLSKIECSYTSEVKKKATCTEDGLKIYTCTMCKTTKEEPIKATGHNIVSATCTDPKRCEDCDFEEGNPLGHIWENVTCTIAKTCSRCGKTEGSALGHSWDKGTVIKESSYTSTGEKAYSCNRCGTQKTEILPMLQSVLILPSTPISITYYGKDKAIITGITYQDVSSDPTPYFTVEILLEKTAGNGYAIYRIEIYDSNGYQVDSVSTGIQGEVGTKKRDTLNFYGFPPGEYTLKIVEY